MDRDACWDLPREEREEYQEKIEAWQEEFTDLEVKRAIAIGPVESAIEAFKDDFDWTFLNKRDREKYLNTIFGTWGAQVVIIVVLFAGTVFMKKRRDVAWQRIAHSRWLIPIYMSGAPPCRSPRPI